MRSPVARALIVSLVVLLSLCARRGGAQTPHPLDGYARDWAEQAELSASWRMQRGEEVLAEGSRGFVRGTSGEPIAPDTVFWIGSISKQFASVAILKLVEQGKVELGAPITRYLPELSPEAVSKDGVTCTIEHVLSHRCGFARDLPGGFLAFRGHLSNAQQEQAFLAAVNETRQTFVPGTGYVYSNLGYDLIGLVVQRASGQSYEAFLEQSFSGPLGMTHTGLAVPAGETLARGRTGALITWVDSAAWLRFDVEAPGERGTSGNLHSTPRDLLRWNQALHHGRVLQPASYDELIRPHGAGDGLGIVSFSDRELGTTLYHNGALAPNGYSSMLAYVPDRDLAVCVLTSLPLSVGQVQPFASALLRKAAGLAEKPRNDPGPLAKVAESSFFALMVLLPLLVTLWLLRFVWRSSRLDAQSWWLSYHSNALVVVIPLFLFGAEARSPLLWLWASLVLAGAYKSRWWTLPTWRRGGGWKSHAGLFARTLWFLFLVPSISQPILWAIGVVIAGEALMIVAATYRTAKRRSQTVAAG
jgi:CubicO group peptidase (beta-lactamase class C family)